MEGRVRETSDLSEVYPDMGEQFSNKHLLLLGQLKETFTAIYEEMQPEEYVMVNGVGRMLDVGGQMQFNFGLENGVTVLVKRTYLDEDTYINGNHMEEELIFDNKGQHIEGQHSKQFFISELIRHIRKQEEGKQYYGGIIYVHANLPNDAFSYQECYMVGVTLALLLTHQSLQKYSTSDIMELLQATDHELNTQCLENILSRLQLNHCLLESHKHTKKAAKSAELSTTEPFSDKSLKTSESNQSIASKQGEGLAKSRAKTTEHSESSIESEEDSDTHSRKLLLNDKTMKIIMCRLDVASQQQQFYLQKMSRVKFISQMRQEQLSHRNQYFDCESFDSFSRLESLRESGSSEVERELGQYYEASRALLQRLILDKVSFSEFISEKHTIDLKSEIYDEEVVELLADLQQQAPFLENFCIVEGKVLMVAVEKHKYADAMRLLRKLLNEYKLSTSQYLSEGEHAPREIGEVMFSTMPSLGCAVYRPSSEELWI